MARKLGPKGQSMKNNKAPGASVENHHPTWDGIGHLESFSDQHDLGKGDHREKVFSTEELFEMVRLARGVPQQVYIHMCMIGV